MDDDQSMRDRVAGQHDPGDPAGDGPQPGSSPVTPRGALADDAAPGPARAAPGQAGPAGPAEPGQDQAGPAGPEGPDKPEAAQDEEAEAKRSPFWRELIALVVVALVIALVIKTFVVQAFYIPSSSMENTLEIGNKVLVNKLVYHLRPIQAGDIVVFNGAGSWNLAPPPAAPTSDPVVRLYRATLLPVFRSFEGILGTTPGQTDYIKRVIGVPGDHVACCNVQGLVTVNGVALHEQSYLYPGAAPSQIRFRFTVPPGRLWVMGDNRQVSDDSRLHRGDPGSGTIPENKIIGRAFMIVWPPSRWRILQIPATFGQAGITKSAAAAAGDLVARAGPAAPYLPLAGGVAVALPVTWLERRVRLRRRRGLKRR
jgi:signal peptidase I